MAAGDYRSCDVCGGKAFYDANLDYQDKDGSYGREPYLIAGEPQYDTPEKCDKWGVRLAYVGDWAVICHECSKTHRIVIRDITGD